MNLSLSIRQNLRKENLQKYFSSKNLLSFFFVLFISSIFLINTLHESYPDEFDNIMGGWYFLHGQLIYKDWFTHHGPIAYLVASLIEIFSGQSFVRFRYLYAIFLVLLTFIPYLYLKKYLGYERVKFYFIYIFLLAISATYFWGHMLLADSLSGFLIVPIFALLVLKAYYREKLIMRDFIFVSILGSLALLSSISYTYLIAGIYFLMVLYYLCFPQRIKILKIENLKPFIILITPFFIFLIYLLITGSFSDYIHLAIQFNQKYYIYNYPRPEGSTFINPLRYAIVIGQTFHNNFSSLLLDVPTFNLAFPFNISLAIVNVCLVIYLAFKRRFTLALFLVFFFIYSNSRSDPWMSKETDYQSAVYIMVSLFNIGFFLTIIYQELKKDVEYPKKVIFTVLFLLSLFYTFFNVAFLFRKFSYKAYDKYMGVQSTIYDRPKIAPIINSITTKDDYALIGPFEFEELFYLNTKVPTKFQILIPGMGHSPEIQEEMIRELQKNKPKVIYFDKQFFIFGVSPEQYGIFFLDYLKKNYLTLQQYNELYDQKLYSKIPIDNKVDLETKLYISKDKADLIIKELLQKNLIEYRDDR